MRHTATIQIAYRLVFRHMFSVYLAYLSVLLIYTFAHAAGITTDGSLGGPATTLTGPNYTIPYALGQQKGANLFHSFGYFNVGNGENAIFTALDGTANIIGRVTGGKQSEIYGSLTCRTAGANLWLLNPFGILFGPNSSLDIKGSFHASTADYLQLSDGGVFYTDPSKTSKLTTAPPSAFGFLSSKPADIIIKNSTLKVPDGESLSIIGGDIRIEDGHLVAPGGRVNLASLGSPSTVEIISDGLKVKASNGLGNIYISNSEEASNRDSIDVSGAYNSDISGIVDIYCKTFSLYNSGIQSQNRSNLYKGGEIRLIAEENALFDNSSYILNLNYFEGAGGDIDIQTGNLVLTNAVIRAYTSGSGDGGDISIKAKNVSIDGGFERSNGFYPSMIACQTYSRSSDDAVSSGNAGSLNIDTESLTLSNGGKISAETSGSGDGGDISIKAKNVSIDGGFERSNGVYPSMIACQTYSRSSDDVVSSGNAGSLNIDTGSLTLSNGGRISAETYGSGDGGDISIHATNISIDGYFTQLSGDSTGYVSSITADTDSTAAAGKIIIETEDLSITNGGMISARTNGSGKGGDVQIKADRINIDGEFSVDTGYYNSVISTTSFSDGDAGDIYIRCNSMRLTRGGAITANTYVSGDGGDIYVLAKDIFIQDDAASFWASGIRCKSSTRNGVISTGNGGTIKLETDLLQLLNGGEIAANAEGIGVSGSISILAAQSITIDSSSVKVTSNLSDAGNINIDSPSITMTGNSEISGSVSSGSGSGGHISLNVDTLSITEGSRIESNTAGSGSGGNITVAAGASVTISGKTEESSGIYGTSTGAGSAGSVTVQTPILNISDSGEISTSSSGSGTAGSVDIQTKSLEMNSGASISSASTGTGNAGSIMIAAKDSMLLNDAAITVEANSASAGDIKIQTPNLDMTNTSQITASVSGGSGSGGSIDLNVDTLSITEGSRIESNTAGSGSGGNITVAAGASVTIFGKTEEASGMYSTSTGAGSAGSITVKTPTLNISDSGEISSSASGTGPGGSIDINVANLTMNSGAVISSASTGTGDAGNINLTIADKLESRNSTITTESTQADGGDITITNTGFLTYLINSFITATVGGGLQTTGGNIRINSPYVVLKDSHVIANAYEGKGGNIGITADTYLADWTSTVSASSALGISGQVDINSPLVNLSGLLSPLPTTFADITELLADDCETRYKYRKVSSLVVRGRDALPAQPGDLWPSPVIMR